MVAPKTNFIVSAENRASAVLNKVSSEFGLLGSAAKSASSLLSGLGVALSIGGLTSAVKGVVDLQDKFGKLAQQTGIGVTALTELNYAASLSDVSTEELATGVTRLTSRMADAAQGSKEAAAAFAGLGIDVKKEDGTLRSAEDVLKDIAGRFAGFEDGATKTAYAVALFGRSGAQLIPLLNSGRNGLAEMAAEARRLGVTFDEDASRAAEEFNDNLTRATTAAHGLMVVGLTPLIGELASVTSRFLDAAKAAGGFWKALAVKSTVSADEEANPLKALSEAEATLGRLKKMRAELDPSKSFANRLNDIVFGDVADLDVRIDLQQARVGYLHALAQREIDRDLGALFGRSAPGRPPRIVAAGGGGKPPRDEIKGVIDGALQRDFERFLKDLTGLDDLVQESVQRDTDRLRAAADSWKDIIDPTREYVRQLEEIRALVASGGLSPADGIAAEFVVQNAMQDQVLGQIEETKAAITGLDEFTLAAARNIQGSLGQGVYDFLDGKFEDIGKSFGNMLKRITAEAIAADFGRTLLGDFAKSGKVGGVFGSIFGSLFGGARAEGGPVAGGVPYLVGERGPELFVPKSSGTVMPNGSMGGVTSLTVAPQITVNGEMSRLQEARLMTQMRNVALATMVDQQRRGGMFS